VSEAKDLVERSFAQYLATLYLRPQQQAITELTTELTKLDIQLAPIEVKQLEKYEKLSERLKEERRLLKLLENQAEAARAQEIAQVLKDAPPGTVLYLKGKHVKVSSPVPAVLVAKVKGSGHAPNFVCLSTHNRWYVATTADVVDMLAEDEMGYVEYVPLPEELMLKAGQVRRGKEETEAIAQHLQRSIGHRTPSADIASFAPEVFTQSKVVEAVKDQLDNHPLHYWGNPSNLIKRHKRRLTLQEEIHQHQAQYRENQAHHWQEFLNLIEVLRSFGCLDNVTPTPLGKATAAIRGDNELWLGLALMSGEFDQLDPHHLAGAMCALVTETPRPDSWTNYLPPEPAIEALVHLKGTRQSLLKLQYRYDIMWPIWPEYKFLDKIVGGLMGLVEQWALGVSWTDLCANTSLDEGDVVRILRRTVDILSQIPHVPAVPNSLRVNAIRAIQLLDRFPVNEVVD
jgi:superfamily II RNA helicase